MCRSRRFPAAFGRTLALGVLVAVGSAASAEESRFYVDLFGGLSLLGETDTDFEPSGGGRLRGKAELDPGWLGGGAFGIQLNDHFRAEAEMVYRRNSVKDVSTATFGGVDEGDYASLLLMANAYYEITELETSFAKFRPYVGIGLGFAEEIDADLSDGSNREYDSDGFAYQFLAGVKWRYASGFTAGLGVRHTRAGRISLKGDDGDLDVDYNPWAFTMSVGYRF